MVWLNSLLIRTPVNTISTSVTVFKQSSPDVLIRPVQRLVDKHLECPLGDFPSTEYLISVQKMDLFVFKQISKPKYKSWSAQDDSFYSFEMKNGPVSNAPTHGQAKHRVHYAPVDDVFTSRQRSCVKVMFCFRRRVSVRGGGGRVVPPHPGPYTRTIFLLWTES